MARDPDFDDENQEGPGVGPANVNYSAGRRIRGLSAEDGAKLQRLHRDKPKDPGTLTHAQQVTLALELGFNWSDFGQPTHEGGSELAERISSDAEALFLQLPAKLPVAFYASVFGSTAPTLFWSDLGHLIPSKAPMRRVEEALPDWWRSLNLVRMPAVCEKVLGEPCAAVLKSTGFDGSEFEMSLAPGGIGTLFAWSPRAVVTSPAATYDPKLRYRQLTGFGVAQIALIQSLHLYGVMSGALYGVEEVGDVKKTERMALLAQK